MTNCQFLSLAPGQRRPKNKLNAIPASSGDRGLSSLVMLICLDPLHSALRNKRAAALATDTGIAFARCVALRANSPTCRLSQCFLPLEAKSDDHDGRGK